MKRALIACGMLLAGCGASGPPSEFSLAGIWWFSSSPPRDTSVTFSSDGGYLFEQYVFSNYINDSSGNLLAATGNYQDETGTYLNDATTITFSPTVSTCPGAAQPPYALSYTIDGPDFVLERPGSTATFQPEDIGGPPGTAIIEVVTGCFASDGSFTSSAPTTVN
jgi:hypothetical protein